MLRIKRTDITKIPRKQQSYVHGHLALTILSTQPVPARLLEHKDFVLVDKREPHDKIKACVDCGTVCIPIQNGLCSVCHSTKQFVNKTANSTQADDIPYPDNLILAICEYANPSKGIMRPPYSGEQRNIVLGHMKLLTLRTQQILQYYFQDRMSIAEIALETGYPQHKIRKIIASGFKRLCWRVWEAYPRFGVPEIMTLGLSAHTVNILYSNDILTLDRLCTLTPTELSTFDRFGKQAYKDICCMLASKGLSLAKDVNQETTKHKTSSKQKSDDMSSKKKINFSYAINREDSEIGALPITNKTYLALRRNGISTIQELCSMTLQDIQNLNGVGVYRVADLMQALEQNGLQLCVNS